MSLSPLFAYTHMMSHTNNTLKLRTDYVAPNLRTLNMSQMKHLISNLICPFIVIIT